MTLENVILAISVLQDNTKPDACDDDEKLLGHGSAHGFVQFKSQPTDSPDLNALDFVFFNPIQSLQHKAYPNTIDKLIK